MPGNQRSLKAWYSVALPLGMIELIDNVAANNQQTNCGPTTRYGVVRLALEHYAKSQRKRRHATAEAQEAR